MNKYLSLIVLCVLVISCTKDKGSMPEPKRYSIEQFYKNKQIGGGAFSPDETTLLFHSNESGIYNLYEVNIDDGSQRQLTHSTGESYFAVDYVPGTNQILYSADQGGNEINHLYLLKEDGSSQDLTPGQQEKASFFGWSLDKQALFYLSNKRNPSFFDLYKMRINEWKPELIYANDQGFNVGAVSWDENRLALVKTVTTSENRLFLYDRSTEEMDEISIPEMPGSYRPAGFSKDGQSFFYITDAEREFAYLVKYDLQSGQRTTLYQTDWDVMYSYDSENEKYRVIAVNEDGKNVLTIIDNISGEPVDFPEISDGDVIAVAISKSETMMRLSVGTSKAPVNLYVYNFDTRQLKKLTQTLNPEINPDDLVAAEVVRYQSFDCLEIPAIYYKPLAASAKNKMPALVWVHGGPGGQSRTGYSALIQFLVNHGYAVLAVNNRGSSGYGKTFYKMDDRNHGDKDLLDCIWGKKWLLEQDYINPDQIGIIGGSYGGFMTMAAMTFHPDKFKVGVNIFGVTNWVRTLRAIPPWWESMRQALYTELGDPTTADSVRLYNISPLFHAHQVKNPVMVLQGANDPRVLQVESDEIVAALKQNNVPVEYIIFPDEGHGFRKRENEIRGYGEILRFLDEYLKSD
ncbi:MAG TPA: S9 family peptidase [bacterium]|nr:S9 family peptidase [bacterium]